MPDTSEIPDVSDVSDKTMGYCVGAKIFSPLLSGNGVFLEEGIKVGSR